MTQWALKFVADPDDADPDDPADSVLTHLLAGRWFVSLEGTPACGVVADIAAERTTDGIARRFVCDKPADHVLTGEHIHRQVTDLAEGRTIEWSTTDAEAKAAEVYAAYQRNPRPDTPFAPSALTRGDSPGEPEVSRGEPEVSRGEPEVSRGDHQVRTGSRRGF